MGIGPQGDGCYCQGAGRQRAGRPQLREGGHVRCWRGTGEASVNGDEARWSAGGGDERLCHVEFLVPFLMQKQK